MTDAVAPVAAAHTCPHALRAFRHRDFRLFWGSAVVSTSGSQMQLAALGWVVAVLTGSATRVALVALAGVVPLVLLGPVGGSLADRFPRRRVLVVTQAVQMGQAVALYGTWQAGLRSYWLLFALALVGGITAALNAPVWQAYVPALVPRADLPNAVMLNSTQFNVAKAVGPVAAGVLLAQAGGASLCFLLNALSFAAVLAALLAMRTSDHAPGLVHRRGYWADFLDGLRYVRGQPGLRTAITANAFTAFVGQPLVPLIPVIALELFHADSVQYGALAGALGVGAILGAVLTGRLDGRRLPSRIVATGAAIYALSVVALGIAPGLAAAVVAMTGVGTGFLVVIATDNSCIQALSSEAMRGRVVAIWLASFGIFNPLGVLVQGALVDAIGARPVLVVDGLLLAAFFGVGRITGWLTSLDTEETVANLNVGPVDVEEIP